MPPVCSAENASVEKVASTQTQTTVGSQISSLRPGGTVTRVGKTDDDKRACLLASVIGSLARDDNVMHVALTQARAADTNELCFLLQLRNGLGAAVTHSRTQTSDQLVNHLSQRPPVRHAALDALGDQLGQAVAVTFFDGIGGRRVVHGLGVTLA